MVTYHTYLEMPALDEFVLLVPSHIGMFLRPPLCLRWRLEPTSLGIAPSVLAT